MTMTIWHVEILGLEPESRWIPMYQPCYSRSEAFGKAQRYYKTFGSERVRVSRYERTEENS